MAHKIDPETNMPEVSGDLFWRVQRGERHFDRLVFVSLMEWRKVWYSRKPKEFEVDYKSVLVSVATPRAVQSAALQIIQERAHDIELRELMGDYPPKKLPV